MFPVFCFPIKKEEPLTTEEKIRLDETVMLLRDGRGKGKSLSWAIEQCSQLGNNRLTS